MPILEVKNIKKGFGDTDVLKGVSFSMERGQVLAIIGSSGSGKTTLLRCLNFLETPDEGEIWVNGKLLTGENLSDDQIRQNRLHFGLVFQNFNLFPQYTALENIMLAPSLLKKGTPAQIREDCLTRRILTPTSCPAVSSSGSPLPARWLCSRRCCALTNPPALSTRS